MTHSSSEIDTLISRLGDDDPVGRGEVRSALTRIGQPAVPALIAALKHSDQYVRWEAAKALTQIPAAAAIPALLEALTDENSGVRWLAAEALVNAGDAAVEPTLKELLGHSDSIWFREGAHHVLTSLVTPRTTGVVKALEGRFQAMSVPVAASKALESA